MKTHLFHRIINGTNDSWTGVVCIQGRGTGGFVFLLGQQNFQTVILVMPCFIPLIKGLRQSAPAHIMRQDFLLLRVCLTFFTFHHLQYRDGLNIRHEFGFRAAFPQMVIRDAEVFCNGLIRLRFTAFIRISGQVNDNASQGNFFGRFIWNRRDEKHVCIAFIFRQQSFKPLNAFCTKNGIRLRRVTQLHTEFILLFDDKGLVVEIDSIANLVGASGFSHRHGFDPQARIRLKFLQFAVQSAHLFEESYPLFPDGRFLPASDTCLAE